MSLALLTAATRAFTQYTTLNDYLRQCCIIITTEATEGLPKTFIRCDVAHFMKLVSRWKSLHGQIRRNKQFYLRVMGQAVQASSIVLLKKIFFATFTVAFSETEGLNNNGQKVPSEICKDFLKNLIGGGDYDSIGNIMMQEIEKQEDENRRNGVREKIESMKEWAKSIARKCKKNIENNIGDRGNQQYLPKISDDIISICRYLPLWSAVMLPYFKYGNKRISSNAVESSFNNLKNRIFSKGELPARVDDFIVKHIKSTDGSIKLLSNQTETTTQVRNSPPHCELFNKDKNLKDSKIPAPVKLAQTSISDCPACSDGNMPTGAHKCIICKVPVHVFPECSEAVENEEEGYGEKRKCKNCCRADFERTSRKEMSAVENWRGKALPFKKRSRSYLDHDREWLQTDFSTNRPIKNFSHLKNGNSLSLKPISVLQNKYILNNTCAFDSLICILTSAYIDSNLLKTMITKDDAPLFELVRHIISHGVTLQSYKMRAEILKEKFKGELMKNNIIRLSTECAAPEMLKKVLTTAHTLITESVCSSKDCPMIKREIKDASVAVCITNSHDVENLQKKIEQHLFDQNPSICNMPKNISDVS